MMGKRYVPDRTVRSGALIVLGMIMILVSGCKGIRKMPPEVSRQGVSPLPVKVVRVEERMLTVPVRATGHLEAKDQIRLSFKTGGIIRTIPVEEGVRVKKGELLASLDLSEIEARVNEALLAYRKAVRDYKRVENLYRDSVATLEQLEHVRTARDIAYNNLRIARFNLKHSVIRAPSEGKVLRKLAEEGEVVGAGMPVLLFASTDKAWVVKCHVPDKEIVRLRAGDSAVVRFDAWRDKVFPGTVTLTGSAADPYTNTYSVEVTLSPSELPLVAGLIGSVRIYSREMKRGVAIPYRALREGDRMRGEVWVVRNQRAVLTEVEVKEMLDSFLLLAHGLQTGDTLVVEGGEDLTPGEKVKIVEQP